jgi:hypothetical protein
MVDGPSGVPSRPGGRDDAERFKRAHIANAFKRRVASKGMLGARSLWRIREDETPSSSTLGARLHAPNLAWTAKTLPLRSLCTCSVLYKQAQL